MLELKNRFEREAKVMILIALALVALLAILAGLLAPWLSRSLDIDRCPDGGGKFDYENNKCISVDGLKSDF